MKVNSDYRSGLDKMRNDPLQTSQGGARFGQMVVKQEQRLQGEQITRLSVIFHRLEIGLPVHAICAIWQNLKC